MLAASHEQPYRALSVQCFLAWAVLAWPVQVVYVDDDDNIIGEEDEDEDITDNPSFSLTIGEEGTVRAMDTGRAQLGACLAMSVPAWPGMALGGPLQRVHGKLWGSKALWER